MNRRDFAVIFGCLALGLGAGVAAAGCGEDRGSVDVEGGTTGSTVGTTGTTSTTGTTETSETTSTTAGPAGETVNVTETEFSIKPRRVEIAQAGVVEFRVRNRGGVAHALEVESEQLEEETEEIPAGGKASLKVDLPAGTYELYCPIGDHEDRGMKAELVVGG